MYSNQLLGGAPRAGFMSRTIVFFSQRLAGWSFSKHLVELASLMDVCISLFIVKLVVVGVCVIDWGSAAPASHGKHAGLLATYYDNLLEISSSVSYLVFALNLACIDRYLNVPKFLQFPLRFLRGTFTVLYCLSVSDWALGSFNLEWLIVYGRLVTVGILACVWILIDRNRGSSVDIQSATFSGLCTAYGLAGLMAIDLLIGFFFGALVDPSPWVYSVTYTLVWLSCARLFLSAYRDFSIPSSMANSWRGRVDGALGRLGSSLADMDQYKTRATALFTLSSMCATLACCLVHFNCLLKWILVSLCTVSFLVFPGVSGLADLGAYVSGAIAGDLVAEQLPWEGHLIALTMAVAFQYLLSLVSGRSGGANFGASVTSRFFSLTRPPQGASSGQTFLPDYFVRVNSDALLPQATELSQVPYPSSR